MSYILECIRDSPAAAYDISGSVFVDRSSNGNTNATVTGAPAKSVGLAKGTSYSGLFGPSDHAAIDATVMQRGNEQNPFSIEVTVLPCPDPTTGKMGYQKILSSTSGKDGITINDNVVSFSTQYVSSGMATASFDISRPSRLHIVGVHTRQANHLFVNGERVATIALSEDQMSDKYISSDGKLMVGGDYDGSSETPALPASTGKVAVSNVLIFDKELSLSDVSRHYQATFTNRTETSIRASFGGSTLDLTKLKNNRYMTIDSMNGWTGFGTARIVENTIQRSEVLDAPQDSYWSIPIALDRQGLTSLYGVTVRAEGVGFSIEYSTDNDTFSSMDNNSLVPLASGFDPTNQVLIIRFNMLSTEPTAQIISAIIEAYGSGQELLDGTLTNSSTDNSNGGRAITIDNMIINDYYNYQNFDDRVGISGDGSFEVSADTSSDDKIVGTEEYWIKRLSSDAITLSAGTVYINGVAQAITSLPLNVWSLVHVVRSSASNIVFGITGDIAVATIGAYPTMMTAQQCLDVYNNYMASDSLKVEDDSNLAITTDANTAYVYANTWEIVSSG